MLAGILAQSSNAADAGLTLTLRVEEDSKLTWSFRNGGTGDLLILSYWQTPAGRHYDAVTLEVAAGGKTATIPLTGIRKAASQVICVLRAGTTLEHSVALADWASAACKAAGARRARAIYTVETQTPQPSQWTDCGAHDTTASGRAAAPSLWRGTLASNWVELPARR
jgi:hypothetical protein